MVVYKTTVKTGYGREAETIDWDKYKVSGARNYSGDDELENAYADSLAETEADKILDKYNKEPAFKARLANAIMKRHLTEKGAFKEKPAKDIPPYTDHHDTLNMVDSLL